MVTKGYAQARRDLPNLPPELFNSWLDPLIAAYGWQPHCETWQGILRHQSLSFFQTLNWKLENVSIDKMQFACETASILFGLFSAAHGCQNQFSIKLQESQSRINSIRDYVTQHRKLPSSLVMFKLGNQHEVADGYRRLTTFFLLKNNPVTNDLLEDKQSAWVGYPN